MSTPVGKRGEPEYIEPTTAKKPRVNTPRAAKTQAIADMNLPRGEGVASATKTHGGKRGRLEEELQEQELQEQNPQQKLLKGEKAQEAAKTNTIAKKHLLQGGIAQKHKKLNQLLSKLEKGELAGPHIVHCQK